MTARYISADDLLRVLDSDIADITECIATYPDDKELPEWRGQLQEAELIRGIIKSKAERESFRAAA